MSKILIPYVEHAPALTLLCISDKLENFTVNKQYKAIGRPAASSNNLVRYSLLDDNENTYELSYFDIGFKFKIMPREVIL